MDGLWHCQGGLKSGFYGGREPLCGSGVDPTSRKPVTCEKGKRISVEKCIKGMVKSINKGDITRDNSIVAVEGGEPCIGIEHGDLSSFRTITHPL